MSENYYPEVTILGAGLSGLSFAYHYPGKSKIFEKMNKVGGTASTDREGEFFYDHGPHVSFTNDSYVKDLLAKATPIIEKVSKPMNTNHSIEFPHPALFHLYRLPKRERSEILKDLVHSYKTFDSTNTPENYYDWLIRTQGKYFAKNYTAKYTRKFWQTDPKNLTTDWVSVRIPTPSISDVIDGAIGLGYKSGYYFEKFRYPKYGGFEAFSNFWKFRKKDISIHLNKEVTLIDHKNKIIRFSDNNLEKYNILISTIPLPEMPRIVSELPEEIKYSIKKLKYTSLHYVNLAVRGEWKKKFTWLYFYDEEIPISRLIPFNTINPTASPRGYTALQVEIPYTSKYDVSLTEKSLSKLQELGYVNLDKVMNIFNDYLKYGYVVYNKDRQVNLEKILSYFKKQGIYLLGRYGTWGYLWSHQVILQGKDLAKEIAKQAKYLRNNKILDS